MKILFLEDDVVFANIVAMTTKKYGIDCTICHEQRSLDGVDFSKFGIVLLDLWLPDGYAEEVVQTLFMLKYTGPIIIISGQDDETIRDVKMAAEAKGMNVLGTFSKPVDLMELINLARKTLSV
jgi:two-component system chemotaxis response regulator CheY